MDLVRSVTDEHVLRALMEHRRLTRAELATAIGISKPTAGESVRRLEERGLVSDTGERTPGGRGRGRVGSYYALAPGVGLALAVTIAPEGVVAACLNAHGDTLARDTRPIGRPAHPDQVAAALRAAVSAVSSAASAFAADVPAAAPTSAATASDAGGAPGAIGASGASGAPGASGGAGGSGGGGGSGSGGGGPVRVAVVGAADPVDRATGRLVQLPDAPFLVGELDPVAVLTPFVTGPVIVDNDVNWLARAERDRAGDRGDFAYLYLGEGLGCAIVNDGEIRRGRTGLAGEIAHLVTTGPRGRAVRFIELFAELGLRRDGSTAIDVDQLLDRCTPGSPAATAVCDAVAGVVAATVALADPQEVVIGGTWGPALIEGIRAATARTPRPVDLRPATVTTDPVLTGVRAEALAGLRAAITAAAL
ncbi:ROK family transcriptional regulator [Dactylosporangium sp. CA-152071]|uniref:ROK family transcriptional regulator n=1 Tax=Dactylosporangium sp. CA-152071 TaxID=3239933 RepID=UPI003D8AD4B5